jgi:hypothetical protein
MTRCFYWLYSRAQSVTFDGEIMETLRLASFETTYENHEVQEEVCKLITQLHAQAAMISGEGLENFNNHSNDIKDNYLWSICDLAERALALITRVPRSAAMEQFRPD